MGSVVERTAWEDGGQESDGGGEDDVITSVSFGGGVNSTALLVGLVERGDRPDHVLFADTKNEMPSTYEHIERFSRWLEGKGFPSVTIVNRSYQRHASLEDECYNLKTLPSKAFGYSGCSVKWKRQPMDKFLKDEYGLGGPRIKAEAARFIVGKIRRLIGIDYGEQHRGKIPDDDLFTYSFPLIEWKWAREECVESIRRHGLSVPVKSACFFCPSSTKKEVLALASAHPDLFARAIAIEGQAENLQAVQGLGRHWSWREFVAADTEKREAMQESDPVPCACFDGDAD